MGSSSWLDPAELDSASVGNHSNSGFFKGLKEEFAANVAEITPR